MNYKKTFFLITMFAVLLMVLFSGGTYAYYTFGLGENATFNSVVASDVKIEYQHGDYIKPLLVPINDKYSSMYASKYNFSIIVDKKYTNYEIGFLASVINVNLDSEFNQWLDYLKYELVDGNNKVVFSGDFSALNNDVLNLNDNMVMLDTNYLDSNHKCYNTDKCEYVYQLRLWISDICPDSNDITTCPNYIEQYDSYKKENCFLKDGIYDCSSSTKSFVYNNSQNVLQNKNISMNIKIDTGLRK